MTTSPAITASLLTKKFRSTLALDSIDVSINPGEICALLGPNGAGKSTLIRILAGLLKPTVGISSILGTPSSELKSHHFQKIGYVAESKSLPSGLTIRQFLAGLRPFYPTWDTELEASLLSDLNLNPKASIDRLSRGEAMKTQLASTLAFRPEVLLLDEPLAGIDANARKDILSGLLDLASTDSPPTILITTHHLDEIEHVASHFILLDQGRVTLSSPADQLTTPLQEAFQQLGSSQ